jgi:hypothetical protein
MIPQYIKNELIKDQKNFAFYNESVKDFLSIESTQYLANKYKFSLSNLFISFSFILNVKNFLIKLNKKINQEKILGYKNTELKTLTLHYSLKTALYELDIFTDSIPRKLISKKFRNVFEAVLEQDMEYGTKFIFYQYSQEHGLCDLSLEQNRQKLEALCIKKGEPFQYPYDFINLLETLKSEFKKYKIAARLIPTIQENHIVTAIYYQFLTQSSFFGFFKNVQYHQVILRYIG